MRPDAEFIARDAASHPPALTPGLQDQRLPQPAAPAAVAAAFALRDHRPGLRARDLGLLDHDLIRNYARGGGAPLGERIIVHGRVLDEEGRPVRRAMVEVWQANAARPLPPRERHLRRSDRPQLPRLRPGLHRRGRLLPLPHDQARRLSVAQPAQRLAARPYPLLVVRHRACAAVDHPDVFRGRSAVAADPILKPFPPARASGWCRALDLDLGAAGQRWPTASTWCCAAGARRCSRTSGRARTMPPVTLPKPRQTAGPHVAYRPGLLAAWLTSSRAESRRRLRGARRPASGSARRPRPRRRRRPGARRDGGDLARRCRRPLPARPSASPEARPARLPGGRAGPTSRPAVVASPRSSPARRWAAAVIAPMAPHVALWIFARGINIGLSTRLYFGDEPERTPRIRC